MDPVPCLGRTVELALVERVQVSCHMGMSMGELAPPLVCCDVAWAQGRFLLLPSTLPTYLVGRANWEITRAGELSLSLPGCGIQESEALNLN